MNGRPLQLFLFRGDDLLIVDAIAHNGEWDLQRLENIPDYESIPHEKMASIIRNGTSNQRKEPKQARHTILVLERSDLALLNLIFPSGDPDETRAMLELELDRQLPLDLNKISYGYHRCNDGEQDHVQVYWSPLERVRPRLDWLRTTGVEIEEIYPTLPFYSHLSVNSDSGQASAQIFSHPNCIDLVKWSKPGIISFSRHQAWPSTVDLETLYLELERSLAALHDYLEPNEKIAFFSSGTDNDAMKKSADRQGILLIDRAVNLKWMNETDTENNFPFLPLLAVLNGIPVETPAGTASPSLLMLNMLPRSIEDQRRRDRLRRNIIQAGSLLLLVVFLAIANIMLYVNRLQTQIDHNTAEIKRLTPEARQVEAMEERIASIRRQISYVISPVEALGTINGIMSTQAGRLDGLFLDHFDYTETGLISLEGHATNDITPWSFAEALDKSGRFKIIKKPRTERKSYGESRAIRFQLSCQALRGSSTKGANVE